MNIAVGFYLGLLAILLVLLVCYYKAGALLKCFFFTGFSGLGALGILWLVGRWIQLPVSVTPFSMGVSAVLGIPGVVFMLVFPLL